MSKSVIAFFLMLIPAGLFSQLSPVTNQYILNPLTINPSLAGSRGVLNIAAFYRRQWVGIDGAPETMTLSVDAPLFDSRLGLGLTLSDDKIGVTKETRIHTSYAYNIRMRDGNLSMGLGAGVIMTNTAWSELTVEDPGDEDFLVGSRVYAVPDFSFGVYYSRQNYFAGISVPKILEYSFNYARNSYSLKFDPGNLNYLFHSGYLFNISPGLAFLPSTLITFSPGRNILYDINGHFSISDRMWIGGSYRSNRSVAALIQFAINYQLKVAYSYDFDFGRLGQYSNGSHEVMVRYEFRYKVKAVNQLIF